MSLGTGIDLVEVSRIQSVLERHGERFLKRVLSPGEIEYCLAQREPAPFIAARFAAKEAVSKAFGTGIGSKLGWRDIEVIKLESGKPLVALHGKGRVLWEQSGARGIHVSLSHTANYATAVVVLD
jgi:holo-[acyl-carrier protein] synthase